MYSDDIKSFDIAFAIVFGVLFTIALCLIIFSFTQDKNIPMHVHFIDTNECYNIKNSDVYKGVATIWFEDDSKIKCSAENVVVYVNHPCDYCDWGH